jgi:hypothetical protein
MQGWRVAQQYRGYRKRKRGGKDHCRQQPGQGTSQGPLLKRGVDHVASRCGLAVYSFKQRSVVASPPVAVELHGFDNVAVNRKIGP